MESTQDSSQFERELLPIPKAMLTMICIPEGPFEGRMAYPCICGYETDIEDPNVVFQYSNQGIFRYVHNYCVNNA